MPVSALKIFSSASTTSSCSASSIEASLSSTFGMRTLTLCPDRRHKSRGPGEGTTRNQDLDLASDGRGRRRKCLGLLASEPTSRFAPGAEQREARADCRESGDSDCPRGRQKYRWRYRACQARDRRRLP